MSEEIVEYELPSGEARDGIAEEDNAIPMWFTVTFWASVVFAAVYIPY